jgi:hypothetical protein
MSSTEGRRNESQNTPSSDTENVILEESKKLRSAREGTSMESIDDVSVVVGDVSPTTTNSSTSNRLLSVGIVVGVVAVLSFDSSTGDRLLSVGVIVGVVAVLSFALIWRKGELISMK